LQSLTTGDVLAHRPFSVRGWRLVFPERPGACHPCGRMHMGRTGTTPCMRFRTVWWTGTPTPSGG